MTRSLANQTGLSLIEVLSAIALFTVIATGLNTSLTSNISLSSASRTTAAALALAQNKIEQIRQINPVQNVTPADLTLGTHSDPNNPLTALGATNGTFTRTWTVASVPQYLSGTLVGNRTGIAQVTVTVSWSTPVAGSLKAVTYACTTPLCAN